MANPILESLLAPYQRAIKGTPTTRGSIADDPLLSLLLPQLQARSSGGGGGTAGGGSLPPVAAGLIDELLWRTDGHYNHLHLASDELPLVRLGKLLQRKGFAIGEHPKFGGVDPVHTESSYHYRPGGQALDINYYGGGRWKNEPQALDWLYNFLQRRYG
jgi:hypothetical protein